MYSGVECLCIAEMCYTYLIGSYCDREGAPLHSIRYMSIFECAVTPQRRFRVGISGAGVKMRVRASPLTVVSVMSVSIPASRDTSK